jgi:hypothetical protein
MWTRTDVPGSECVVLTVDVDGLRSRGHQQAVDPVPYVLQYELSVTDAWTTTVLVAHAEGAGWTRDLELRRAAGEWSCRGRSRGVADLRAWDGQTLLEPAAPGFLAADDFAGAVDVDIGGSPLTNALPVHRLQLLGASEGHVERVVSAWVLPPTLQVEVSRQSYTVLGGRSVRFGDAGSDLVVEYDSNGWVSTYEGLAKSTH